MTATPDFSALVGQIMADRPGWQTVEYHDSAGVSYECQDTSAKELKLMLVWRDEHVYDWHDKPTPARISVHAYVQYPVQMPRQPSRAISMSSIRPLAALRRDFESRLLTPFMADIEDFRAIIACTEADIARLDALVAQVRQWYPALQAPDMMRRPDRRSDTTVRLCDSSYDIKATVTRSSRVTLQLDNLTPDQAQAVLVALYAATPPPAVTP